VPTDINLLDNAVVISGNTTVRGRLGVVTETVPEGKKQGVALAHVAGDVLKINPGQSYAGGVSFDGAVRFGNVTVKPGASFDDLPHLKEYVYAAKICANTILFETTPIMGPGGHPKTTTLDLVAIINRLLEDVTALKAKVAALESK
jgi:hypothetical protein